jgi:hypothetical protein
VTKTQNGAGELIAGAARFSRDVASLLDDDFAGHALGRRVVRAAGVEDAVVLVM